MSVFSDEFISYIGKMGHTDEEIKTFTQNTRLYHDLGVWGEEAEDYLRDLYRNHGVDFSSFIFLDYFPPEWPIANNIWQRIRYYFWRPKVDPNDYKPFTLHMLEQAMLKKKWTIVF